MHSHIRTSQRTCHGGQGTAPDMHRCPSEQCSHTFMEESQSVLGSCAMLQNGCATEAESQQALQRTLVQQTMPHSRAEGQRIAPENTSVGRDVSQKATHFSCSPAWKTTHKLQSKALPFKHTKSQGFREPLVHHLT